MLIENILGNIQAVNLGDEVIITIPFEWFEVDKKRIKKIAADGRVFGIMVESILKDGDILARLDGCIYVCEILPTFLTKTYVSTMQEMGKLCFELGNRHLSLKIDQDSVSVPYDTPTFLYLERLGFKVFKVYEKFYNFTECKAHGSLEHPVGCNYEHDHAHSHTHRH